MQTATQNEVLSGVVGQITKMTTPKKGSQKLKNKASMIASSNQVVSQDAMQAEWLEIQAAQANPARFRPLYDRYYEQILRFIYRRTGEEMLAGDLCAQVFMKAMQKLHKYQFKGVPFSAWLYRIASNEVAQHYRDQQKNRTICIDDANVHSMVDEDEKDAGENILQYRETLLQVLDELKPKDVQLIEMRFFEQRPFKEIADIMGITESNAKVKTYRLLERLKKKMLKRNKT